MKLKYITLLFIAALFSLHTLAQTNKKGNHKAVKKTTKQVTKTAKPKGAVKKANAKNIEAALTKLKADTSKKAGQNNNLSEEIVVTTAYKPVLADAVKIRINPDLNDESAFKAPLTYAPVDKRLEQNTDIKQLDAMKRPAESDAVIYNNLIKGGVGTLTTKLGELYINNGRNQTYQIGGYVTYLAEEGNIYRQKTENAQGGIFVKIAGKQNTLSGRFDYSYASDYFYGYNPGQIPLHLQTNQQTFNIFKGEAELAKNFKDIPNDFNYALKIKGYSFSNTFNGTESNMAVSGFLNETIHQFNIGLSGSVDLSTQQDSLYQIKNNLLRLNPFLKFQGETYKLDAGLNIVSEFGTNSSFHIFPAAKVEFQILPTYIRFFADLKGDVAKSTLLDFFTTNPFLGNFTPIKNTLHTLDISVGLKGTLAPQLGFKITGFRNGVKNMPLFISDFKFDQGYNRFTVIYDGGTSTINGLSAEFDYKATENLDFFVKAEYTDYQMATVKHPWNIPTNKITGGTIIHITKALTFNSTIVYRGSTQDPYTLAGSTEPTTIKSFIDLNAGIDFKATKRIAIFAKAFNILNTNNQKWLYYADYGFNVFGGASLSF
jgi:hypothetical protein